MQFETLNQTEVRRILDAFRASRQGNEPTEEEIERVLALVDGIRKRYLQVAEVFSGEALIDLQADGALVTIRQNIPQPERERRIAYHEAGHAIVAVSLRRRIKQVSIVPNPERRSAGHVAFGVAPQWLTPDFDAHPSTRGYIERELMCLYGGLASELVHLGTQDPVAGSDDMDKAHELACRYCSKNEHEAIAYCRWLMARTATLLERQGNLAAVETVVRALLAGKVVSARQVRKIWMDALMAEIDEVARAHHGGCAGS